MPNFFTDNRDILFHFENLNIKEIVSLTEHDFEDAIHYNYAPKDYQDAIDNYYKVLEIVGDIAANVVAPNAPDVDKEGNNKYITEILADTMMVIEKKPGQSNYSEKSDTSGNDSQSNRDSSSEVNEPDSDYTSSDKDQDKKTVSNNYQDDREFENSQNEDDLPF